MEGPVTPQYSSHRIPDPNLFQQSQPALVSQPDIALEAFQFDPQLANQPDLGLQDRGAFDGIQRTYETRTPRQSQSQSQSQQRQRQQDQEEQQQQQQQQQPPRFHEIRSTAPVSIPPNPTFSQGSPYGVLPRASRQSNYDSSPGGQMFGVLTPHPSLTPQSRNQLDGLGSQNELDMRLPRYPEGGATDGHFRNLKMIPNPPNLEEWRQKLFDVDDAITLTEDEFQTYFPHVDNVYSHRSTQNYKRKPFVSHYWDCRLKGRPPGTKKSDDPNKKKRKRQARERDQCDVKIKITEFFPGARTMLGADISADGNISLRGGQTNENQPSENDTSPTRPDDARMDENVPGADGARYYTIQRVNGNGANGKGDGTVGGHRHSLEDSDKIKKNSIHRHFIKEDKERRKSSVKMSNNADKQKKTYHKKATGAALTTVKRHSKEHDLKLYGSCFCPFVQRIWISLEVKGLSYQYIEIDPYKKTDEHLQINPRGLVPALRHGDWGCYESSVLMEYLEDLNAGIPLLPHDNPRMRAHCRLWSDHINRKILPPFYGLLQAQEQAQQNEHAAELNNEIAKIVEVADPVGPFFLGPHISFVDIQFAPWIIRVRRVLTPYRGWPAPEPGTRWASWVNAIESNEAVKATTSTDDLYTDSYERYAENRPDTSQLAKAINDGHGLP